jgi:thiamine pyrophosphokinase
LQTVALIADGQIDSLEKLRPSILRHQRIVAVDGGLAYCQKLGIRPHLIVGDFDSCPPELLSSYSEVPQIVLEKEKDETDLEAAINEETKRGARSLTLFGAWGRRIDHSLGNLLLLTRHPGKIAMETEKELLFAIDRKVSFAAHVGQTLSLIPINGPVLGITTKGLKWELNDRKMDQNFFGISNICLKTEVEISVEKGCLVCCVIK